MGAEDVKTEVKLVVEVEYVLGVQMVVHCVRRQGVQVEREHLVVVLN